MSTFVNAGTIRALTYGAEQWYKASDEVQKSIIHHSCVAGGLALLPIPLAGEIGCIVNQVHMYKKINELTGVKFSENVLKCIGNFLLSQVGAIAAGFVVAGILKFIPGINLASMLIQAPLAAAINFTCGKLYYVMLGKYITAYASNPQMSDEEIETAFKEQMLSKDEVKQFYKEGKEQMKSRNFDSFKAEAQSCANEAKAK